MVFELKDVYVYMNMGIAAYTVQYMGVQMNIYEITLLFVQPMKTNELKQLEDKMWTS